MGGRLLELYEGEFRKMALFLSTYVNKIDKKGRVSVPASFRVVITGQHLAGIVAYPSPISDCIEACSMSRIISLSENIDRLDTLSEERDAFAVSILGNSQELQFDAEGRVLLPEYLIQIANLDEQAVFVGKGQTFDIWEPKAFEEYSSKARDFARKNRDLLHPKTGESK